MADLSYKNSLFPPARFTEARILVVDDMKLNVKLICEFLKAAGYTNIATACDGIEALKETYRFEPDLVLLDIMMPNLDGFGYCEQIRNDTGAARMPIIMQTALDERDAKLRGLSCGADDFLPKPLDPDELILRVRIHLERYFMYQDIDQMRSYLKMELDQAKDTIKRLEDEKVGAATRNLIGKHYDVLKTMTVQTHSEN
jgi:sigma-B regulation protein RsbU (phosphoserine phosphatase)